MSRQWRLQIGRTHDVRLIVTGRDDFSLDPSQRNSPPLRRDNRDGGLDVPLGLPHFWQRARPRHGGGRREAVQAAHWRQRDPKKQTGVPVFVPRRPVPSAICACVYVDGNGVVLGQHPSVSSVGHRQCARRRALNIRRRNKAAVLACMI